MSDDWDILGAAFDRATRLQGDERTRMLADFAREHPGLARQLEDLLVADGDPDDDLHQVVASTARSLSESADDPWVGRQIGAWTIKQRIADGGMGAVFLAERSDREYAQTAALKIMTAQLLAKDAVARFRAERQILASLNHPNIAKLIDGGSTTENLPYLVLEYVDGLPVDVYCDENRLDIEARLKLFMKVCDAVDYAHRNLVVHRDLKPNNILVDSSGEPKLLDFGIAKLLESNSILQTVAVTQEGTLLLTPEYASPEQVRGESPTVATDVYALGVLLYRMLTGQSPYADSLSSKHAMERAILETVPKRPSTSITVEDTAGRSRSPTHLRKRLSGDLDNIVMMTLQKEAARRYATVTLLHDDIGNFLAHRPVQARADSFPYRSGKFLRRNRLPVSIAVAFIVTIASLTVFYTQRLAAERDIATAESQKANEVSSFLVSLFTSASPDTMQQPMDDFRDLTAREVLDYGLVELRSRQQGDALIRANLLAVLARVYERLDVLDKADELSREALGLLDRAAGQDSGRQASLVGDYCDALATQAIVRRERAQYEDATAANNRCRSLLEAAGQAESSAMAYALFRQARISEDTGELGTAEQQLLDASSMMLAVEGELSLGYVRSLDNLASLMATLLRNQEAVEYLQRGLAISQQLLGDAHPAVSQVKQNLATTLSRDRPFDETYVLGLMQQALAADTALFDEDHFRVARAYSNIAFIYGHMSDHDRAIENSLAAVQILERIRGPLDRRTLGEKNRLAMSYYHNGDFETAETYLLESIDGLQQVDPENEVIKLGYAAFAMGSIREDQGRYADAESYYRDALQRYSERYGADSRQALDMRENLVWAIGPQGRVEEGDAMYRELLVAAREKYATDNPQELGRMAETHAEWLDAMQLPERARVVREQWASEIAAAQAFIDLLTKEEEERFENAEKARQAE